MSFIERRRANRFELQSPVIIRWRDGNEIREAQVMSEDVSSNGIYFVMSEGIKEGTHRLEYFAQTDCGAGARMFRTHSTVRSKEGANVRMAVAIGKYEFSRGKANASADVRGDFNVPEEK